jgi:PPM family protein phosphatase
MLQWHSAALTHRGGKREQIQDSFYMSPDSRVFVVADGRGGVGDNNASSLAVKAVEQLWHERQPLNTDKDEIQEWISKAISGANAAIWAASKDQSLAGMYTNISLGVQSDHGCLFVAHVGDTSTYQIRRNKTIKVITDDYANVNELLAAMTEWVRRSPQQVRMIGWEHIRRCIGLGETVAIEESTVAETLAGDCIIFATDGLRLVVNEETIVDFTQGSEPEVVCQKLVNQAIECGIQADVSVIVIKYFD